MDHRIESYVLQSFHDIRLAAWNGWRQWRDWYSSLSPTGRNVLANLVIWVTVAGIIFITASGLTPGKFFDAVGKANLPLFIGVNLASFLIWWLGETYLFSTLFTLFHGRTSFREVLPATSAQYFLQTVNSLVAAGALVLFLHARRGVPWLTGACTMLFQGLVDGIVLASIAVLAAIADPTARTSFVAPYAAGALVLFVLIALWWGTVQPAARWGKWLRAIPSLYAFRSAGLRDYVTLGLIRCAIFLPQIPLLYLELHAFHANISLLSAFAVTPALLMVASEPLTPSGLGPLQAVMVNALSQHIPQALVLSAGYSISIMLLLWRIPLGLGSAAPFVRTILAHQEREDQPSQGQARAPA